MYSSCIFIQKLKVKVKVKGCSSSFLLTIVTRMPVFSTFFRRIQEFWFLHKVSVSVLLNAYLSAVQAWGKFKCMASNNCVWDNAEISVIFLTFCHSSGNYRCFRFVIFAETSIICWHFTSLLQKFPSFSTIFPYFRIKSAWHARCQDSTSPQACKCSSSSVVIFTNIMFVIVIVIAMQGGRTTSMVLRLRRLELARAGRCQLCSWEAVQHYAGGFWVLVVAVQRGAG